MLTMLMVSHRFQNIWIPIIFVFIYKTKKNWRMNNNILHIQLFCVHPKLKRKYNKQKILDGPLIVSFQQFSNVYHRYVSLVSFAFLFLWFFSPPFQAGTSSRAIIIIRNTCTFLYSSHSFLPQNVFWGWLAINIVSPYIREQWNRAIIRTLAWCCYTCRFKLVRGNEPSEPSMSTKKVTRGGSTAPAA